MKILKLLVGVFLWIMGWYSLIFLMGQVDFPEKPHQDQFEYFKEKTSFAASLMVWDGHWYRVIANQGYFFEGKPNTYLFAFFPAYPTILGLLNRVFNPTLSVMIINTFCLLMTTYFLSKLDPTNQILILFLVNPAFIFFLTTYSESMFFLVSVILYYSYKHNKYVLSSVVGLFGSLIRTQGILFAIPWFIKSALYLKNFKRINYKILVPAIFILAGFFSWYTFGAISNHSINFFATIQQAWDRDRPSFFNLTKIIARYVHFFSLNPHDFHQSQLDISLLTLALSLIGLGWIKNYLNLDWVIFSLTSLGLPLLSGSTMSIIRFSAVILPLYLVVSKLVSQQLFKFQLIVLISFCTSVLTGFMFIHWYWIA